MQFDGKILVIGLGGVSRCTLPLLFKHLKVPPKNYTVMDFDGVEAEVRKVTDAGARFVKNKVERHNMGAHDVAKQREDVPAHVPSPDGIAAHQAAGLYDLLARHRIYGRQNHRSISLYGSTL